MIHSSYTEYAVWEGLVLVNLTMPTLLQGRFSARVIFFILGRVSACVSYYAYFIVGKI